MNEVAQQMQKATFDRARALAADLNDPTKSTIIETKMDKNGGFYAANLSNRTIEYAYPTSIHATHARKSPAKVAEAMLYSQSHITLPDTERTLWMIERWQYMRAAMVAA
jgi:hypothetical protein